ncbi:diguanylate cyclase domain-containing protein [Gaopeijia maritima]|uniref:diguanylate cyclase n=1 Tax=Gaopeijia maritima TaxID=3119007 RepID=A0ABU9E5V0_9BACT
MPSQRTIAYHGPGRPGVLSRLDEFAAQHNLLPTTLGSADEVRALLNRSYPACVVLDAVGDRESMLSLCADIKRDAFTAIVPVIVVVPEGDAEAGADALEAGADEVLTAITAPREWSLRLELVLRRAARDVSVHPTTRLPGTIQIERDIFERIQAGSGFAVCYADLDHFKEFNDRYGYNSGDRVILLLSKILRDVVRALAPGGFVGHIGGDDFIFNVPMDYLQACCDEVITLFDELIPYQYTGEDRSAGYFLGKDRRGNVHRIPLMTLSIGVVTNQVHDFSHTGQVSELAAEMKTYAKSLPGSKYVVDRRRAGVMANRRSSGGATSPILD